MVVVICGGLILRVVLVHDCGLCSGERSFGAGLSLGGVSVVVYRET